MDREQKCFNKAGTEHTPHRLDLTSLSNPWNRVHLWGWMCACCVFLVRLTHIYALNYIHCSWKLLFLFHKSLLCFYLVEYNSAFIHSSIDFSRVSFLKLCTLYQNELESFLYLSLHIVFHTIVFFQDLSRYVQYMLLLYVITWCLSRKWP